jgi:hypothetical protein
MAQSDGQGVLRPMINRADPDPVEVPITAARAIRLAAMRAAADCAGLTVQISGVGEQVQGLDPIG